MYKRQVTFNSQWTWNQLNTVPYVKLATTTVDATMGTVQTQTKAQQDAGGYFGTSRMNTTSAAGNACTVAIGGIDHRMPCAFNWPYQAINYSLVGANGTTNNTRLAWGTNFGFLGAAQYPIHGSAFYGGPLAGDPRASGHPRKGFSAFIVLGLNSLDPVAAFDFSASTGAVQRADPERCNPIGHFGLRWQAERDTAFARMLLSLIHRRFARPKAPSSLRSAGAVQKARSGARQLRADEAFTEP